MESDAYIKKILQNIERGKQGLNVGLPMGLKRLGSVISNIQPKTYTIISGGTGCYDSNTEYFNGKQWKFFSDYKKGEKVLMYNGDGTAELVIPSEYIKKKASYFYNFKSKYGIDQMISGEHTVITLSKQGSIVKTRADKFVEDHNKTSRGSKKAFITTFRYKPEKEIDVSKDLIRNYIGARTKVFPDEWYNMSSSSLKVFHDELKYWDGSIPKNSSKLYSYSSNNKKNIDFVQFVCSSLGYRASVHVDERYENKNYTIYQSNRTKPMMVNSLGVDKIDKVYNHDGMKYCFTVPSGMLVTRRNDCITISGNTGKTAFVDTAYVSNPYRHILTGNNIYDLEVIYFSLEIDPEQKITKLIANKLWADYGLKTTVGEILSKGDKRIPLEVDRAIGETTDYFVKMGDKIKYRSAASPDYIYRELMNYAKKRGKITLNDKGIVINYQPHNPMLVTLVIVDHIGLIKPNSKDRNLKEAIDRASKTLIYFRNIFGFAPVVVSQFNRAIEGHDRMKGDNEPKLSDLKESGGPSEDANLVIGLYYPYRYMKQTHLGYDMKIMRNNYRSAHILKNRDGPDGGVIGLAFNGGNGFFREMPTLEQLKTTVSYDRVLAAVR